MRFFVGESWRATSKCAKLLTKTSKFVQSYVQYLHQYNFHVGPRALSLLIERIWIVNAKETCSQIVRYLQVFCDFNLPEIGWLSQSDILAPSMYSSFLNVLSELSLFQNNNVPNCSGRMPDLVFSYDILLNTISRIDPLVHPEDLYLNLAPVQTASLPHKLKSRCFRKTDFGKNHLISEHD